MFCIRKIVLIWFAVGQQLVVVTWPRGLFHVISPALIALQIFT